MPKRKDLKKILIIGSGPIIISQACEFDYSGTQACKALREEGYSVVLINSNPATIMTDPETADRTYIEPITPEAVEKIIALERPDALLPTDEQIENESYRVGDNIRAYVVNLRSHQSNIIIILSRSNPEFVKKLFEAEIPEIFNGQISIRKIVREPGIRTKVELDSNEHKLDPISACVGVKGTRIDSIRRELHGEQIDIVVHSDDPEQMIINALGIDGANHVIIERNRAASVIVSEENKVIAIGKQGKNVKLAAKLTGMKIDIFTSADFEEKMAKERRTVSHITELDGVNAKIAEALKQAGYTSVQDIFAASLDELCNLEGVGQKTAERLKEAAKYF